MTITIADGRGALWQWDTWRRLRVGSGVKQIHYQNRALGGSVDVDVGTDGTAIIPDELLQDCHTLTAYAYVTDDTGAYTMVQQDFAVHKRAKPAGYVYTPTDQMTLRTIQRQIGDLAGLTTEAKDTLVAAINEAARTGGAGSMDLRVADGYIQYSTDGGSTRTNLIAMAELKGGKGDPGAKGDPGDKGDTGAQGAKGDTGATGPAGVPGKDGAAGADGKSAYEYAVEGGYGGTEEEFASELGGLFGGSTATVLSDNLFDKSIATTGKIFYHSSSGPSLVDVSNGFYAYVPLRGAGTYTAMICWVNHGESYAKRVPILKEDKTFLQNVTGTLTKRDSSFGYIEFTITETMISNGAALYAFDGSTNVSPTLDEVMIVKDRKYPSEYIPYGYIEVEAESADPVNILSGKTAVFLGDSICAGTTTLESAAEYGYGWGGLIGEANKMKWKNFGRNGGTIAPISSVEEARRVPTQVDLALVQYPDADYVIFEGGCNDADTLGESNLGTFSASGYAPEDTSTFTGAFEVLVLKILNSFPNAKIGYIVAQKMGVSDDYGSANNRYRKFFDRAVEICQKWGIPVIDLWNETPLNPKLAIHYDSSLTADQANENEKCYTDGQHLTLTGYKKLQNPVEEFMRKL